MPEPSALADLPSISAPDGLCDGAGAIPTFPPLAMDARGRIVPLSDDERRARADAASRAIRAMRGLPDDDPPGTEADFMRGIDANRPDGRKVFEGMS